MRRCRKEAALAIRLANLKHTNKKGEEIMGKLGYRLAQMMVGRYGFDQFSRDLLAYGMILSVCDMFIPGFWELY